jgi:hypothetical protein
LHLAEASAPSDGGDLQSKLITGHDRAAKARAIDGYEIAEIPPERAQASR